MVKVKSLPRKWFIAVVVALALIGLDQFQAHREASALLATIERSEAAMREYNDASAAPEAQVESTRAANTDSFGVLEQDAAQADLAPVLGRLQDTGQEALADLEVARSQIESVWLAPWHQRLRGAQTAYLDHNAAWLRLIAEYIDADSDDTRAESAQVEATWRIAQTAWSDALPWLTISRGLEDETTSIFVDDP